MVWDGISRLYITGARFSFEEGIVSYFVCPACAHKWTVKTRPVATFPENFDFNHLVKFTCPKCSATLELYVAIHKEGDDGVAGMSVEPIENLQVSEE